MNLSKAKRAPIFHGKVNDYMEGTKTQFIH